MNLSVKDGQDYYREWVQKSGVHPGIYHLNVYELFGQRAIEALTEDAIAKAQRVTSYTTTEAARILARHENARAGGWAVAGLDPLNNWEPMSWFQMKPDQPRVDARRTDKEKLIKYEAPEGVPTRAFFLRVPFEASFKTTLIYGRQNEEIRQDWLQRFKAAAERILDRNQSNQQGAVESLQALYRAAQTREFGEIDRLFCEFWHRQRAGDPESGHSYPGRASGIDLLEDTGYWPWVYERNLPTTVTEGAKKSGALLTVGQPAIALPGITQGIRTRDSEGFKVRPSLIPELKHFATPGRQFMILLDHETRPKQKQDLARETSKLARELTNATRVWGDRSQSRPAKVVLLPGPEKGVDDFLVAKGEQALHQIYATAKTLQDWQAIRNSQLNYPADLELNQPRIGDLDIPADAQLIAIRSPKGTGKTYSFKKIVREAHDRGERVLLITHRVQLGVALCDVDEGVGIPFVTELRESEEGEALGFGACIDSLHGDSQARFNANYWHKCTILLDEIEQLLWHLLSANTEVSNRRIEILEEFQRLLFNVFQGGGRVILADADLTDLSINFIRRLSGQNPKTWIVRNDYQPVEPWQVFHYGQHNPNQLVEALIEDLEAGGKALVMTHSQKKKGKFSTCTLERFINQTFPELKVLRIDSQSIADPSHPAFECADKLNQILPRFDVVLCSPTIETGVSINIRGHFTAVWGIFHGVTTTDSVRQSLARVRDNSIPRHIWVRKRGLSRIGNGSISPYSLKAAQLKEAKVNSWLLGIGSALLDDEGDLENPCHVAFQYWAQFAGRINYGMDDYRGVVLRGLEEEGHQIATVGDRAKNEALDDLITYIRDKGYEQEREAIATAPQISDSEYEKLKGRKEKTEADWHKERRHSIEKRYLVPITPDIVKNDDNKWYPQLRLCYYLTMGEKHLQARDRQSFESEYRRGQVWLPTFNRSQIGAQIALLKKLNIKALMDPNRQYCQTDPELQHIKQIAQQYASDIRSIFGFTVPQDQPETEEAEAKPASAIQIAQMFLQKLGLKLHSKGRKGPRGDRQRVYEYRRYEDDREAVFLAWFERDELAAAQAEAQAAATRTDSAVSTPPINNYSAEGVAV